MQCKNNEYKYSESMFAALGIQHAMRMGHVVFCGLSGCTKLFYTIALTARFSKKESQWIRISVF